MKSMRHFIGACALAVLTIAIAPYTMAGRNSHEIPITTNSEAAKMDFIAGQAAMDAGDAAEANELFRSAISNDPDFGYAWLNVGNVAFSGQEFASSIKKASLLADKLSEGEQMLIAINMYFLDNNFDEQLALAKKLTKKYPKSARAWMVRASAQNNIQDYNGARSSMRSAVKANKRFAPAHVGLANSYLFNEPKDFAEAESHYKAALNMEPGQGHHYWGLGDVYRAMGKLEIARDFYTRSVRLDPNNATAYTKRAHVNSFLGHYNEARADYDEASRVAQPGAKTFLANYKYFTYIYDGKPAKAVEGLQALHDEVDSLDLQDKQRDGAKIFTLTNAAIVSMHNGMDEDAQVLLSLRAKEMRDTAELVGTSEFRNIQEADIAYFDGLAAAHSGNLAVANKMAEENAQLVRNQENPLKMQQYHDLKGMIELKSGNHKAAAKHYRQADLNNVYTKYHLAMALDGAGEKAEAMKLYSEVANFNFNSVGFALIRNDAKAKI